ncbi:GNAT family N-acetyltransferase [Jannaschia sp. Os4]|uniref:GNAT family N-acetyltransferase n=1 Tax=Jannaschia sp. Os4 TaxID=2807617 RepID=UPI001939829C|nr:GNAT family N-acetyltransferase [Jannaschia sp. Os4]MBM2577542.1 GNAT family N-acetyltransferase [Jannaschia sp. Os4]
MTDLTLRRAEADDAPACAKIVRDWLGSIDWMPDPPAMEVIEAMMREGFPEREAYVAERLGTVVGYVSLDPDSDHIRGLYVAEPGGGVGRALVERVKEGRDRLTLNTHAPNADAHRFYAREGFAKVSDETGSDGIPEHRMEWTR